MNATTGLRPGATLQWRVLLALKAWPGQSHNAPTLRGHAHDDALRGLARTMASPQIMCIRGEGRYCGEAQAGAIALKGLDIMDTQTLLIIIVLVLLLGGGGWYGRGRWF